MKKFDFIIQSLIIGLAFGFSFFGFSREGEFYWFFFMYAQLFLGPWQFISSLINFIAAFNRPTSTYKNLVNIHLSLSVLYLSLTGGLTVFTKFEPSLVWIMIIPWLLGTFYYILSYLKIKGYSKYHRQNGSFLSHLKL